MKTVSRSATLLGLGLVGPMLLLACAAGPATQDAEHVGSTQSAVTYANTWANGAWTNGWIPGHLGFAVNPQVILNHDSDGYWTHRGQATPNPFGFVVYFRVQHDNATGKAAPWMTAGLDPTSSGALILCQSGGSITNPGGTPSTTGTCAAPTSSATSAFCSCEVTVPASDAGKRYNYTVHYDGITNWKAQVKIRPPKGDATPFYFAFYSDTHNNPDQIKPVIQAIQAEDSWSFALFGGDIADDGTWGSKSDDTLEGVDGSLNAQALSGFLSSMPVFAALGNHEWHHDSFGEVYGGWPTLAKIYVAAPNLDTSSLDAPFNNAGYQYAYYSFNWGQTHFVVLNTGYMNDFHLGCGANSNGHGEECPNESNDFDLPQKNWLINDLYQASQDPQIKHIIATMHQLPYKIGGDDSFLGGCGGSYCGGRGWLHDIFVKYGVQVALGGHQHSYQHSVLDGIHYMTCAGAGEPDGGMECEGPDSGFGDGYDQGCSDSISVAWRADSNSPQFCEFTVNTDINQDAIVSRARYLYNYYSIPGYLVFDDNSLLAFAAPYNVTGRVVNNDNVNNQVKLQWTLPSGLININYEVSWKTNSTGWSVLVPNAGTDVSTWTVGGLHRGVSYSFRVRGYFTSFGVNYYSNYSNLVSLQFPWEPVTGLSATNNPDNSITLSWNAYTGDAGTPFLYDVWRKKTTDGDDKWQFEYFVLPPATTWTDWVPPFSTSATYRVGALSTFNKRAGFAYTEIGTFGVAAADLLNAVPTINQAGYVTLTWNNDASGFDHLFAQRSSDGTNWTTFYTGASGATSIATVDDSAPQTNAINTYRIGYAMLNGGTVYSSPTAIKVPALVNGPTGVNVTSTGVHSVTIGASTWPIDASGNPPDHIALFRRPAGSIPTKQFVQVAMAPGTPPLQDNSGHCGVAYEYYLVGYYGGFVSLPSGTIAAQSPCPGEVACASGAAADVFSQNMQGCRGQVTWDDRNSLCAPGFGACSAEDWAAARIGQPPHHNYWTDANLQYSGSGPNACAAVLTGGNTCSTSDNRPMRVCAASQPDPEGNTCTWTGCGLGASTPSSPNEYFGGCVANPTAGTLCCRQTSHGFVAPAVSSGYGHTCSLLNDGSTKCWGDDTYGQIGLADGVAGGRGSRAGQMGDALPAVSLGHDLNGAPLTAKDLGSGLYHNCAVLNNGSLKCWGYNGDGELGLGDVTNRGLAAGSMGDSLPTVSLGTGRSALSSKAGGYHSCAILDNSTLKCWGYNAYGELGLGNTSNRGGGANQMGDSLPTVSLGAGLTPTAIAAGNFHTCALLSNRQVKCWGMNAYGELGLGDTNNRGSAASQMGDSLPTVALGTGRTALAIAAGGYHTCALLDNGQVKCWGYNGVGSLGLGDASNRGVAANQMGDNLPAVSLGAGRTAIAIAAGGFHTCALLDNETVKCWGYNPYGELGLGDTANRGSTSGTMGDSLPIVDLAGASPVSIGVSPIALGTGYFHTCASDAVTHAIRCWGYNASGQLGLGDVNNRGDAAGEMGLSLPTLDLGLDLGALR
jgi:alpha-tubulin suppressor-like RCC1 family protein